jgi:hypothetical protein
MSRGELRYALVACWLASACSSLLSLDGVVTDFDGDGVDDAADVCPRDYDPAQNDTNGDGIGDACGPCNFVTHDLDGDGRDDACDSCIGQGPIGVDIDADGIDDGCDSCVEGQDTTGVDTDDDGILDGCDSCIASGFDGDGDGVDDACDVCLFGANNDEDLDGIPDGCDVCPADTDPDQEVLGDETDVGIACDPDPTRDDVRRLFDGFAVENPAIWFPAPDWTTTEGAMRSSAATVADRGSFFSVRAEFQLRTFVRFAPGTDPAASLGIAVSSSNDLLATMTECSVEPTGLLRHAASSAAVLLDVSQGVELRLTRFKDTNGNARGICEAIDHAATIAALAVSYLDFFELDLGLIGRGASGQYDWFEALDHPVPQ